MPPSRRSRLAAWFRRAAGASTRRVEARPRPRVEELETRALPAAGAREQYMLELINRMRTNPAAELNLLLNSGDQNVNDALAFFNVNRTVLQQQWNALTPVQPLAWNDALAASALAHSQLMLQFDRQEHDLPGEPSLLQRVRNAGYNPGTVAENIFAYGESVFHIHAAFAIDWGDTGTGIQEPPGHRQNLMDGTLRDLGLGLVDATADKATGPLLVTQDFGRPLVPGNAHLLGVVYRDTNVNTFYDIGEGLGGVTVTVTGPAGTFTTQSSAAGGYQVQVPPGTYNVTFTGGGLPSGQVRQATVGSANVKLDLHTQLVPQLGLSASAYAVRENAEKVNLFVTRTGDASAVSVRLRTADGTARAGTDYTALDTVVTFAAGEAQKTVSVAVADNALADGDRTFAVTLSDPTGGAQLGTPNTAAVTLQDDDQPGQFDFGAATFEGAEGAGAGTVTVTRTNGVQGTVTVRYATAAGTALNGTDYANVGGTLTFLDGESSKTFAVPLLDDTLVEAAETVSLALSVPGGGAKLGPRPQGTLRVADDDMPAVPAGPAPANLVAAGNAFAHSREHFEDFVTKSYLQYLGRGPDAGGLNYWATAMQNGLRGETLEASFLGSPEYIANHGGGGREWVRGMYTDLLGRTASTGEVDYWAAQLAAGVTTFQVAYGFAASAERAGQRVRANYLTYLLREPGAAEVQGWVDTFLKGYTNEDMVAGFVSSAEYYANPQKGKGHAGEWVASAYRDVLFRDPQRAEVEGWLRLFGLLA